jgi:chromosome segregation ATPase
MEQLTRALEAKSADAACKDATINAQAGDVASLQKKISDQEDAMKSLSAKLASTASSLKEAQDQAVIDRLNTEELKSRAQLAAQRNLEDLAAARANLERAEASIQDLSDQIQKLQACLKTSENHTAIKNAELKSIQVRLPSLPCAVHDWPTLISPNTASYRGNICSKSQLQQKPQDTSWQTLIQQWQYVPIS